MMASQEMLSIEDVQVFFLYHWLGIVLEDEQVIMRIFREPLTLSDNKSPTKKCYLNVSQKIMSDIPIIDPKNGKKSKR